MSQARQMTIVLDNHMRMLEASAAQRERDDAINYWREVILHAGKIDGWFGQAVIVRAKYKIKNLGGSDA